LLRIRPGSAFQTALLSALVFLPIDGGTDNGGAVSAMRRVEDPGIVAGKPIERTGRLPGQAAPLANTLSEMTLPGGLKAALTVVDDRAAPDRSQFLLEFIRRTYNSAVALKADARDATLRTLVNHLQRASGPGADPSTRSDTLPLPLTPEFWTGMVFEGHVSTPGLAAAILQSRNAALLYYGLLSLDDGTREWMGAQPNLVAEIVSRRAAAFAVAAPGLRIARGVVDVPGGESAAPVWQALVGRRASDPADFVRALLAPEDGRLAYFYSAVADLGPGQLRVALNLDAPDLDVRTAAARQLFAAFERGAVGWKVDDRVFSRPVRDPALLVAGLRADRDGRPVLPGTRAFWRTVFGETDLPGTDSDVRALAAGEVVDYPWLSDRIFTREPAELGRRYQAVLFASRVVKQVTPETAKDAVDAVRGAAAYPALMATLERARESDLSVFATAARRADRLAGSGDDARALRALQQFQGALALLSRAATRHSVPAESFSTLVRSLCEVELSPRGEYEGRLVRWLGAWTSAEARRRGEDSADHANRPAGSESTTSSVDETVLGLLAGPPVREDRFVDWEGTRYRLDLAGAEAIRLERLLGAHPRPYLSAAVALVGLADDVAGPSVTSAALGRAAEGVERLAESIAAGSEPATGQSFAGVAAMLRSAALKSDTASARRAAAALCVLADGLLGRGLMELVYVAALGQPDRGSIDVADVARRHDFGFRPGGVGRSIAWRRPQPDAKTDRGWHIVGSLLDLDVALADFSLRRVSVKGLPSKPTLNSEDRRTFIEGVALVDPAAMTDADSSAIVTAIKRGRARIAALRTRADAMQVAGEIPLGRIRRTLLPWVVAQDPARLSMFLSPIELLWLGLETPPPPTLDAWGASADPRVGLVSLQLPDRQSSESFTAHWNAGLLASSFPDLNLRLAELLAELQMPASLLGSVLTAATFDFVNTAVSRDPDDRRGLVEFVHGLRVDRVETYLALLTTDGPLVPVTEASGAPTHSGEGARR
jgi:hypothetical protein